MKISTLGPKGTFSHEAAIRYDKKAEIIFKDTIKEVFENVSINDSQEGIVPIENSVAGSVGQTLNCLSNFDLMIKDEILLPINHHVAGSGTLKTIKSLYVHPQTYEQCQNFIKGHLHGAQIKMTLSNGKSAEIISKTKDKTKAAIIPHIAIKIYGLKTIEKNVEDSKKNTTRFLAVSKTDTKKTKKDRTSIIVNPRIDKPGLLYHLLGEFAKESINLAKIESRPSKEKIGSYIFYIDFEGHREDARIIKALSAIRKSFSVKMLGSYPRKY